MAHKHLRTLKVLVVDLNERIFLLDGVLGLQVVLVDAQELLLKFAQILVVLDGARQFGGELLQPGEATPQIVEGNLKLVADEAVVTLHTLLGDGQNLGVGVVLQEVQLLVVVEQEINREDLVLARIAVEVVHAHAHQVDDGVLNLREHLILQPVGVVDLSLLS